MHWNCGILGKKGTPWQNAIYKVDLIFSDNYPNDPPICKFTPSLFHPNIYEDGVVCLSILGDAWNPQIGIKLILLALQTFLNEPNFGLCKRSDVLDVYKKDKNAYWDRVKKQAREIGM